MARTKTLFLESPGIHGILVEWIKGKRRSRPLKFNSPHAALDWCIQEHAGLVFYFSPHPAKN